MFQLHNCRQQRDCLQRFKCKEDLVDLSCAALDTVWVPDCQTEAGTETQLDGDILHSTTRPPESGATTANSIEFGTRTSYITLEGESTTDARATVDCAKLMNPSSTEDLGWQVAGGD